MPNELSEALELLDHAQEVLDRGDYDQARDLAHKANYLAADYIEGGGQDVPGEEQGSDMPWLYGYIVIFDHKPVEEDWAKLQSTSTFNATFMGEVNDYPEKKHAYWVGFRTPLPTTSPSWRASARC